MRTPNPTRSALPLALVLLAACGGAVDPTPAADASPVLATLASADATGVAQLRGGDPAAARATYEAALAANPLRLGALNDLAVAYSVEGHPEAARRLLDEVVASGGARDQQAALVNLGELYAIEGYVSAARAYFESARGIDPSRPEPLYALALLADARGDGAGARAALADAVRLDEVGAARASFAFVYPEERLHLAALLAEQAGDGAHADAAWRELAQGRFPALAAAADRHLAER